MYDCPQGVAFDELPHHHLTSDVASSRPLCERRRPLRAGNDPCDIALPFLELPRETRRISRPGLTFATIASSRSSSTMVTMARAMSVLVTDVEAQYPCAGVRAPLS